MFQILVIVLPVFALILAGWCARRGGVLGAAAVRELNRFVVYLALPAVLFEIVADARWAQIWQPGFIASFGLAAGVMFCLGGMAGLWRQRAAADAVIDGLNASYANTGFIGFPLLLAVFGREALAPSLIATLLTVCVLFAVALLLIEVARQGRAFGWRSGAAVGLSLLRNPLLAAPLAGVLVMAAGVGVPAPVQTFVHLLGAAAAPCALVVLGLFLAERRPKALRRDDSVAATALLVALKLIGQPLLTWGLAVHVFHLPDTLVHCAVLLAALPTGTGPFMLAEFHQREASLTAAVILVSTVLSLLSITLYLLAAGVP